MTTQYPNLSINECRSEKYSKIHKPEISGYYSVGSKREYINNASNLRYFYGKMPNYKKVCLDLNVGYEQVETKPDLLSEDERINHLLQYLLTNVRKHIDTTDSSKLLSTDIICFRGLLTAVMCTPYQLRDSWVIYASVFKGNIYLCARMTDEKKRRCVNVSKLERRMCSWGYKFEQHMLTDHPNKPPQTNIPVNECEEFASVLQTKLNNKALLYGAEMDGILSDSPVDVESLDWSTVNFVELKTSRKIDDDRQQNNFLRYKALKWWCQSYLAGIDNIVVGFRDDDGIVNELQYYNVSELPQMAGGRWEKKVCLQFLNAFLTYVHKTIFLDRDTVEDPNTVWKFEFASRTSYVQAEKIIGSNPFSFLPSWFVQEMETISEKNQRQEILQERI